MWAVRTRGSTDQSQQTRERPAAKETESASAKHCRTFQNHELQGFLTLTLMPDRAQCRSMRKTKRYNALAWRTRRLSKEAGAKEGKPKGNSEDLRGLGAREARKCDWGKGLSRAREAVPQGGAACT